MKPETQSQNFNFDKLFFTNKYKYYLLGSNVYTFSLYNSFLIKTSKSDSQIPSYQIGGLLKLFNKSFKAYFHKDRVYNTFNFGLKCRMNSLSNKLTTNFNVHKNKQIDIDLRWSIFKNFNLNDLNFLNTFSIGYSNHNSIFGQKDLIQLKHETMRPFIGF